MKAYPHLSTTDPESGAPLLRMEGIEKSFPGVKALKGVDLELRAGEVLALVGENGAGKSTLIKILSGVYFADKGRITIDGHDSNIGSPADARRAGVAVIHQEFNLVPTLSAAENIFLGREKTRAGFTLRGQERREADRLFRRMDVAIDPDTLCRDLTVAQQQVVEIAKALGLECRIMVMDEPSAALTAGEVDRLLTVIRELKAGGMGIIYVSHRLEEVFAVADRVTVLRDGESVGAERVRDIAKPRLIEMMVGRKMENEFPSAQAKIGAARLTVEKLSRGSEVRNVSFTVRAGEILGIAGLVGAGRTETARLIFGADRAGSGRIWLDGKRLKIQSPSDAIRNGICLLTEDRKGQGLILDMSVRENFGLPNMSGFSRFGLINKSAERKSFMRHADSMRIKTPDAETPARNLSGGNQQKVVLAKWLESDFEVIIFDEPTRGIDVGAKYEIYALINKLAAAGKAVIIISSELPEILGMSHRALVMHEGRVRGEIGDPAGATQEQILALAVGHDSGCPVRVLGEARP